MRDNSLICDGAHSWGASLAINYHRCRRCGAVEVFVDGAWKRPLEREKKQVSAQPVQVSRLPSRASDGIQQRADADLRATIARHQAKLKGEA